ncbi:hypothetical protein [Paenibacillus hexagrammi]|uniref:DUF4190 domain-containing protein n=1 Tax=Paenibacillus hexagrammi TaxID=2908839 RepID=A0ABY3SPC5_9BACL|nr:hypothetical protein [Paenibacillus sp. YPD9-1]UJF35094.1 hypothetical protein L0M14_08145 [Paenibacillus sp. YPD9-1]
MTKDDELKPETKARFQREQLRVEGGLKEHEEYAAELAPSARRIPYGDSFTRSSTRSIQTEDVSDEEMEEMVQAVTRNKAVGYTALLIALLSLFVWPVVLGISGVILGIYAFSLGNKALGSWSIALGLLAVFAYFVLVPFYA